MDLPPTIGRLTIYGGELTGMDFLRLFKLPTTGGRKWQILEKNHLTNRPQGEFGLSHL